MKTPLLPCTIVTGASSGIGRELALQLAAAGIDVVAIGRDAARLNAVAAASPRIDAMLADLADIDALPALAARIVACHPDVGALINNAAIQREHRFDVADYGPREIRHEIDANLVAPITLTQALLPHFQRQPAAWIVNVGSALGHVPKRSAAVYSASKAGLRLFTQALRVQMGDHDTLRIVEVTMPLVETPMTAGRGSGKLSAQQAAQQLLAGLHAGRLDVRIGKMKALPLLLRCAPGLLARIVQRG